MDDTVAILPASPTLTDFDSLDGIEDLDAFLDAKGGLSRFPTPPLKDKICIHVGVIEDISEDESEDEVDELDISAVFARELSGPAEPFWDDILAIEDLLLRAHMPIEIVALAFSILSKFLRGPRSFSENTLEQPSAGPLITATLSIATIFTSDHPPPTQYWATHVCQPPVVAKYLDRLELKVLEALDWRLLPLSRSDAIAGTLRLFERRREVTDSPPHDVGFVKLDQMDFSIDECAVVGWANGQLTPTLTPNRDGGVTWLRLN
nr:hypothetical protein B0A51_03300 [Rachicladosporium sp. CCFEE 5018]